MPLLNMRHKNVMSEQDILSNHLSSINGYNGVRASVVLYGLIMMLSVYYVIKDSKENIIIRYHTRNKYYKKRVSDVLIIAIGGVLIRQIINTFFLYNNYDISVMRDVQFLDYTIIQTVFSAFMYIEITLFLVALIDICNREWSAIIIICVLNYIQVILLQYQNWGHILPVENMMLAFDYICGNVSEGYIVQSFTKNVILSVLLFFGGEQVFKEKDIYGKK